MFNRIKNLYLRYEAQHLRIKAAGFHLSAKGSGFIGNVDHVYLRGRQIEFHGWCRGETVSLISLVGQVSVAPRLLRQDVRDAFGGSPHVGFRIAEAYGNGRFTFSVRSGAGETPHHIRPISGLRRFWHVSLTKLKFARDIMRALPSILAWRLTQNFGARQRVKSILGLHAMTEASPLDLRLLGAKNTTGLRKKSAPITIILPIYNAFDLLPQVLERVVSNTDLPWRLLLIEDLSSDVRVRPWLRQWVRQQDSAHANQITLLENPENLGFIKSVNRGLSYARAYGAHVVLLNSDALVPKDWASRLLYPILSQPTVASTTPMSNDAEIFSVPVMCQRSDFMSGQADAMDRVARAMPVAQDFIEVPSGVGFCMALNRDYLGLVPQLDHQFGRGYGEEVDWCQKTRALGGRHVGVPNLFVEHRGGVSFGTAEKRKLIQANHKIIVTRYPEYDLEVQNFIQADPLRTARIMLAISWAQQQAAGQPVPIYLAHSMGGGAENYLANRIKETLATTGVPAVILRVGGERRWRIEVVSAAGTCAGTLEDFDMLRRLLAPLDQRLIVYSCGVGDYNPTALPTELLSLRNTKACQIEILLHDYFVISPTYTLLNKDGIFQGQIDRTQALADPTLCAWQQKWQPLVAAADVIRVFSDSSRSLFVAAYPDTADRVLLCPHRLLGNVPRLTPRFANGQRVIGVLGNIGFHKGAVVLRDLARLLESQEDMSLVVLGNVDPAFDVPPNVYVHGSYVLEDLEKLVAQFGITDWLIPSIWPETFSYTTHEALATGMYTYAFDIGAQGEAVAKAQNGRAISYGTGVDLARAALQAITADGMGRRALEMAANE